MNIYPLFSGQVHRGPDFRREDCHRFFLASAIELTSIYSLVTLELVFSFRMVGFADLIIESSYTTGAAVCAIESPP